MQDVGNSCVVCPEVKNLTGINTGVSNLQFALEMKEGGQWAIVAGSCCGREAREGCACIQSRDRTITWSNQSLLTLGFFRERLSDERSAKRKKKNWGQCLAHSLPTPCSLRLVRHLLAYIEESGEANGLYSSYSMTDAAGGLIISLCLP